MIGYCLSGANFLTTFTSNTIFGKKNYFSFFHLMNCTMFTIADTPTALYAAVIIDNNPKLRRCLRFMHDHTSPDLEFDWFPQEKEIQWVS